jgi:hypothetical protein
MTHSIRTGTMIALASATLFAAACSRSKDSPPAGDKGDRMESKEAPAAAPAQPEKMAKVHCGGVNECKGKSGCQSAHNACAGQNGCKGQGYVELTAEDCRSKGGTVLAGK